MCSACTVKSLCEHDCEALVRRIAVCCRSMAWHKRGYSKRQRPGAPLRQALEFVDRELSEWSVVRGRRTYSFLNS